MIGRVANPKHPAVAALRADADPHLIGQRLEHQAVIDRRQRTAQRIREPVRAQRSERVIEGFFEAS